MKTKLNITFIIMLLLVAVNLGSDIQEASKDFWQGFNLGFNSVEQEGVVSLYGINMERDEYNMNDSIYNSKTNSFDRVTLKKEQFIIIANQDKKTENETLNLILSLITFVSIIYFWLVFIKVVLSVNRNSTVIFTQKLENRLKKCSISLAIFAICQITYRYSELSAAKDYFAHEGYRLTTNGVSSDIMLLVISTGIFMVAEIFTIARKMKEEQELTI